MLLVPFVGIGQTDYCNLDFSFSNENEISSSTFALDGEDFQINDVIGVFYNSNNGLQCVGSATYITPGIPIYIPVYSTSRNGLNDDELVLYCNLEVVFHC